jgi:hypothetical protein
LSDSSTHQPAVAVWLSTTQAQPQLAAELRARGYAVEEIEPSELPAADLGRAHVLICDPHARYSPRADRRLPIIIELAEAGKPGTSSQVFAQPLDVNALLERIRGELGSREVERAALAERVDVPDEAELALSADECARVPRELPHADLSDEIAELLDRAEQRVRATAMLSTPPERLSPEEELAALLPDEILESLDEPIGLDDDDDELPAKATRATARPGHGETGASRGRTAAGTGAGTALGTSPGTGPGDPLDPAPSTALGPTAPDVIAKLDASGSRSPMAASRDTGPDLRRETPPPFPTRPPPLRAAVSETSPPLSQPTSSRPRIPAAPRLPSLGHYPVRATLQPRSSPPDPRGIPHGAGSRGSTPPAAAPTTPPRAPSAGAPEAIAAVGRGDTVRTLARAVRDRYTGALAFENRDGIRRALLKEGDFVTAASGVEGESLVGFLTTRGDLLPEAARLARRLPQFGRHAGAALIAHGYLRQDELWPVLRAHAEWLIGRITTVETGSISLERQVPGRLEAEPSVFGGATGAEVLVEVVRRQLAGAEAEVRLGGVDSALSLGPAEQLLSECALNDEELAIIQGAAGLTVRDVLRHAPEDFAAVLYALRELGVLETTAPVRRHTAATVATKGADAIDERALRARIGARKALVDEGDYFALLGLARSATGYDIRRAYLQLRREFEPSRVLTAQTVDLKDAVDEICEVLEEAYEVLSDQQRRERYRRALEARPSSD